MAQQPQNIINNVGDTVKSALQDPTIKAIAELGGLKQVYDDVLSNVNIDFSNPLVIAGGLFLLSAIAKEKTDGSK